jgi:folate-binding protein YgfZ
MQSLLPNRGVLAVEGADRAAYLQGLITNDIAGVSDRQAIYACLLTAQGRFLHDFFVIAQKHAQGERFLIDCEYDRREDLLKRLGMFRLRSKVELKDVSTEFKVAAVWGEAAPEGLSFADPRHAELGSRVFVSAAATLPDNFAAYDRLRIMLGLPDGSRDMEIEKALLLENNIDAAHGIAWDKGCYMGQELTARMKYRALVKKRLTPVHLDGPAPAPGTLLMAGDKEVGEMRSSAGDVGLALLRIDDAPAEIRVGETVLTKL